MIPSEVTQTDNATAAATTTSSTPDLGREDFLALLIAQLENQDPLNPQDATEFTAQLATFSSLEQQIAMRESIDQLTAIQRESQTVSSVALIGKQVLAETDRFSIDPDAETRPTLAVELDSPAEIQSVEVFDATGRRVAVQDEIGLRSGTFELDWNAFDVPVDTGNYRFRVNVLSGDAAPTLLVRDQVRGAALQDGVLYLGDSAVSLSSIREVSR